MRQASVWVVACVRAVTGRDQRDAATNTNLEAIIRRIRAEMRDEDVAVLEKHQRRFAEQSNEAKDAGNRAQWTYYYHCEQAAGLLVKALRASPLE